MVYFCFEQIRSSGCNMICGLAWRRLWLPILALLLSILTALMPVAAWATPSPNGLIVKGMATGSSGLTVQGVIQVAGVADHPTFRKWQLDLILGTEATFLAFGEEPQREVGMLTEFDTRRYPDGAHKLRLRVVHSNLNYDEYYLDITFANHGQASDPDPQPVQIEPTPLPTPLPTLVPTLVPTPTPPPTPVQPTTLENGLVLASTTLRGTVTVRGIANHENFRKWQGDLLLDGLPEQATFLGMGEEPVPTEGELFTFDTIHYPSGDHLLRLRVVHSNLNYDESSLPVTIDRSAVPLSAAGPASSTRNTSMWAGGGVRIGPNQRRVLYLTFDDGPHLPYTEQVLDLLAQYNAKATFFVVGSHAQAHPDLIQAAYAAGHGIGNHTWSHVNLQGFSQEAFNQELLNTAETVGPYIAPCMRPPYGATDASTHTYAKELGYSVVMWSIETWDWKRPGASTIASRVVNQAFPGAIVLLHDGGGNRSQTVAALEIILRELSAQGYEFEAFCR